MAEDNQEQSLDQQTPAPEPTPSQTPPTEEQPKPEGPAGIPGGFETWEDFGKAVQAGTHDATGKEITQQEEEGQSEGDEESPPAELSETQKQEVEDALAEIEEEARDKARPFFEEFARNGALSAESTKAAAEAFGVSEKMVQLYIKGATAEAASTAAAIYQEAGVSEEEAQGFKAWAEENWTEQQKQEFNAKPQAEAYKQGVADWKASGNGPAPRDITQSERPANANPNTGPQPFASQQEMTNAMNDPRYSKDAAYRAEVEKRVGASNF